MVGVCLPGWMRMLLEGGDVTKMGVRDLFFFQFKFVPLKGERHSEVVII